MQFDISKDPLIKSLVEAVNALLDAENERRLKAVEPPIMPQITVNVPQQAAPNVMVTVEPTPITVNVPQQAAPNITVEPAPVTIQKQAKKPAAFVINRNRDGAITGIEEK